MSRRLPRLKWHMLRRRFTDPPHLRENLVPGLRAGAALEVDLVSTSDGVFVCLHDLTLDAETTGSGPVVAKTAAEISALRQRGRDGTPLDAPPLSFREVVSAVRAHGRRAVQVQLDLKEPAEQFDARMLARLRAALGDAAPAFIVGTTDADVYARLRAEAPDIPAGFDPLELHEERLPENAQGFVRLAELTMGLAPDARIYYLQADLILAGLAAGINLVERVTGNGAEVDAWTVDPSRPKIREALTALVEAGVDQITTNAPEELSSMLQETA